MKLKHFITKAFSLLLAMMMVTGMSTTALAAESSVSFEGGKLIAFEPGSVYTDSDLFDNFKGVMPGDTRSEKITIQNKSNDCDYIKVYLRAVLHDETGNPISEKVLEELRNDERRGETSELAYMYDFLSQLSMTVKNGTEVIYNASPDELDGLAQNVYLGRLRKGDSLNLDVELNVPITMGNEYANRIGEVDWGFVVEGFDDPTPPPDDDTMLTVRKVWVDDGRGRPDSVTVQLLRDGKGYDEVELSQSNNWAYTWDRLDDDYDWSVIEVDVPSDYEVTYGKRYCKTSLTVDETALHAAIVRAINRFNEEDESTYMALMRATIGEAIGLTGGTDEIDLLRRKIDGLNRKMVSLINESVESGEGIESHEAEFKELSDTIELLQGRIQKLEEALASDQVNDSRILQLQQIIADRASKKMEYDDTIVHQMIECVKVYPDGRLDIIFGGGYLIEERLEKES